MAVRIDHRAILASWKSGFLRDIARIKEEEADKAAKEAAAAVRRRVLDLTVTVALGIDSKDFESVSDVQLVVRFDAAIPAPAVERIYRWLPGHMEACEANYGGGCDCVAQGRVG